jgi:hypothetical protein
MRARASTNCTDMRHSQSRFAPSRVASGGLADGRHAANFTRSQTEIKRRKRAAGRNFFAHTQPSVHGERSSAVSTVASLTPPTLGADPASLFPRELRGGEIMHHRLVLDGYRCHRYFARSMKLTRALAALDEWLHSTWDCSWRRASLGPKPATHHALTWQAYHPIVPHAI